MLVLVLFVFGLILTGYDSQDRAEVDAQRIADGWFLYSLLELNQR